MFFVLHRIYVTGWIALFLAGAAWLYPRTGISEQVADWYDVWQNSRETSTRPVEHISGKVTRVLDGLSFTLRSADHQVYSIGLLGAIAATNNLPSAPQKRSEIDPAKGRLSGLILSNEVDVLLISVDPQHRGVGVVRVGETNINAAMIESGLVRLKREYIKGLPVLEQYALIRADRKSAEGQKASGTN